MEAAVGLFGVGFARAVPYGLVAVLTSALIVLAFAGLLAAFGLVRGLRAFARAGTTGVVLALLLGTARRPGGRPDGPPDGPVPVPDPGKRPPDTPDHPGG